MPYTIVRQRVDDFPGWRRSFEEHAEERKEAGSRGGHIFRDPDDRSLIVLFLAWDDLDDARAFFDSEAFGDELEAGGIETEPEVLYLEELGRPNE